MFGMAHGSVQAGEDKITKGYNTMDAMGCMLLRECTDNVEEVFSLLDISSQYEKPERYTFAATEFNRLLVTLHQIGVKVYLADQSISLLDTVASIILLVITSILIGDICMILLS